MNRKRWLSLVLAVGLTLVAANAAQAQVVVYPTTSYYAPSVYAAPYVYPSASYYAPSVYSYSYVRPAVSYSYYPAQTIVTPTVVTPTVVAPAGFYTTYSSMGYGILRPRGVYTRSYYTPYGY